MAAGTFAGRGELRMAGAGFELGIEIESDPRVAVAAVQRRESQIADRNDGSLMHGCHSFRMAHGFGAAGARRRSGRAVHASTAGIQKMSAIAEKLAISPRNGL